MKSGLRFLGSFALILLGMGLFLEAFIRIGIWVRDPWICNPDLYADWTSEETYWKLRHQWIKRVTSDSPEILDPLLGWAVPKTASNPLGATTDAPYTPNYKKPAVLFVGDSFVQGVTAMKDRIPQRLATLFPQLPVYNLGVRGYGVDQIYLRLQQARYPFLRPIAAVGIVTVDLDRSVLDFRTGQKPYFTVSNDALVLRGLPIASDPDKWLASNPPEIGSYFLAMLKRRFGLLQAATPLEVIPKREEKELVNSAILRAITKEAREHHIPLVYVLFYTREELEYTGWHEEFLKTQFNELKVPYVDTKEVLLKKAQEKQMAPSSFYLLDGHLNNQANAFVAEALADKMKESREILSVL